MQLLNMWKHAAMPEAHHMKAKASITEFLKIMSLNIAQDRMTGCWLASYDEVHNSGLEFSASGNFIEAPGMSWLV